MVEGKFMTVNEVAEWLRINPQTVRILIREGKLKSIRLGDGRKSHYRIPFINVLEWLNNQQEKI